MFVRYCLIVQIVIFFNLFFEEKHSIRENDKLHDLSLKVFVIFSLKIILQNVKETERENIGVKERCARLVLNMGPHWRARKTYEICETVEIVGQKIFWS